MPEFRSPAINYIWPTISDSVGPSAEIAVKFSIDIDQSMVNTDTELNKHVLLIRTDTDATTSLSFKSYSDKILRMVPSGTTLEPSGRYQMTVYDSIKSVGGRKLLSAKTWYFIVAGVSVGGVELSDPGDETTHDTTPVFSWVAAALSGSYSSSGFHLQVDTTLNFASPDWETTTTSTSAQPTTAQIISGTTYYWRVRAYTNLATGGWSDIRSFYYGADPTPTIDTRTSYPEAKEFYVEDFYPTDETTNLSAFPTIWVEFNTAPSAGILTSPGDLVTITRVAVDGDPRVTATSLGLTLSLSGTRLYVASTDTYAANRRYTITLSKNLMSTGGHSIGSDQRFFFTSNYYPLYAGSIGIRDRIGPYVDDVSEDTINLHIYKQSLQANYALARQYYRNTTDGPTLTNVAAWNASNTPFAVVGYVEAKAAASILSLKMFSMLSDADRTRAFPDYRESGPGGGILEQMRLMIKGLEDEAARYWAEINSGRVLLETVVKSENWNPRYDRWDMSTRGKRRTKL